MKPQETSMVYTVHFNYNYASSFDTFFVNLMLVLLNHAYINVPME